MAIKLVDREWNSYAGDYRYEFVIDSAADVAKLPKCCAGSTAMVAGKDGALYMVNASGEWSEL